MNKTVLNPGQTNSAPAGKDARGVSPDPAETSAISPNNLASDASLDDPFGDLMDLDFSQYIADGDDDVGSMNSPSSPSVGMMSKTPFKTPAASEVADDPIETASSPEPVQEKVPKLRDYLPGLGSSLEPSFAKDDSQRTRVIARVPANPKLTGNAQPRHGYSMSVSSDDGNEDTANTETPKSPDAKPKFLAINKTTSAKDKNEVLAKKADPPRRRSARSKKITGKGKAPAKQDSAEATENKEITSLERPLLSRMLSVISEPGSLKWEEPLVGSRVFRSPGRSDEASPTSSACPPRSAEKQGPMPNHQEIAAHIIDEEEMNIQPSVPPSFAEPLELSHPLGCERVQKTASPEKSKVSPAIRLSPQGEIYLKPPRNSPSNPPQKGIRKQQLSPGKRGREPQKATAPSKRRRLQEPVKKRVVQARARAKGGDGGQKKELPITVADTHERRPSPVPEVRREDSRILVNEVGNPRRANLMYESLSEDEGLAGAAEDTGNVVEVEPPKRKSSVIQPPVNLKNVFQTQSTKPRVATAKIDSLQKPRESMKLKNAKVQVDSPQQLTEEVVLKSAEAISSLLPAQKTLREPNISADKRAKGQEMQSKKHIGHAQQVLPCQQNPSLEAFRLHILGQLMSLEARQQQDESPANNDSPKSSGQNSGGRVRMNVEPEHMLSRILHAITKRSLAYVKEKEKDLDGIAQEYQSNATAFLDRVEKLHQNESNSMVNVVNKQRQAFVDSCDDGSRACREFMEKLERCSALDGRSSRLEGWLDQCQQMQRDVL
ncbi:uncharacterized protein DNG_00139 [Cephalotrichum gorgonifer]|uniref:Uncharacterized protein n=1 Tax=Cephalotrichum gorgonifer TaxID=2041049 RepID=A0AAE8SQH5_9PEZI|nr:uncharacterized protein DNG_00139 [Cephalotrichum gorgonifer]